MRYGLGSEPDQISASIVGDRMMIISDPVAFVVEELGLFGGPADLHHAVGDDRHFVVPDIGIDVIRASNALKRDRIAACFKTVGTNLQVFTNILIVEHDIDMMLIEYFVRRLTMFKDEDIVEQPLSVEA